LTNDLSDIAPHIDYELTSSRVIANRPATGYFKRIYNFVCDAKFSDIHRNGRSNRPASRNNYV